jgi:hypothetical protein
MTWFTFLSIVLVPVHYLFILPVNVLYFNQSTLLYYASLSFSLYPVLFTVFSVFCCGLCLHRCDVFQYYSLTIILSFFSSITPHESPLTVPFLETYIYIHICPYICKYIYIYTHTHDNACIYIWNYLLLHRRELMQPLSFWTSLL